MTMGDGKPCKRCGTSEWYKTGACKECTRVRNHAWRSNNLEKARHSCRKWYQKNREEKKEKSRVYFRQNSNEHLQLMRSWRHRNREKCADYVRQWRQRHPRKARAANRRDSRRRRAMLNDAPGSFTETEFRQLCRQYGNRCLCCGQADIELVADHVVPLTWEGATNNISNIQPLCRTCNSRKGNKHATDYRPKARKRGWIQKKLL